MRFIIYLFQVDWFNIKKTYELIKDDDFERNLLFLFFISLVSKSDFIKKNYKIKKAYGFILSRRRRFSTKKIFKI